MTVVADVKPGKKLEFSGMLVINKPRGMISKDVSRRLTRILGKQKLGHVGTLDPNAEGVLPILFGGATRLQDFLLENPKTYQFEITFGAETDSLDPDGEVIKTAPWSHLTSEILERAVSEFVGEIVQVPPIYSAVKFNGKPLYKYARGAQAADVPLESLARKVFVHEFKFLDFVDGVGHFEVTCSKGTYIRSLVKSLAEAVGSCGTLTRLLRSAASGVTLADAVTLEDVEARVIAGLEGLREVLIPMSKINLGLPQWISADADTAARLRRGNGISLTPRDYLGSFANPVGVGLPGSGRQGLMLLDPAGFAVGLGDAFLDQNGRVTVSMRRGL
jgi:tRNA pseudouridine55 synthase